MGTQKIHLMQCLIGHYKGLPIYDDASEKSGNVKRVYNLILRIVCCPVVAYSSLSLKLINKQRISVLLQHAIFQVL